MLNIFWCFHVLILQNISILLLFQNFFDFENLFTMTGVTEFVEIFKDNINVYISEESLTLKS